MLEKFEIHDISTGFQFEDFEQLGTKAKHWVIDANETKFLFKKGREHTGENWAEVVACEIAELLQLPHAHYHLALEDGIEGILTNSFVPEGGRLIHGNELLPNISKSSDERKKRSSSRQHTVSRVRAVTHLLPNKPMGWDSINMIRNAEGVFAGYLLLDTLIANQDRHYENWGYILTKDATIHLAPTFDHASSLGRNEPERVMKERLTTKDKGRSIESYVTKAKSSLFLKEVDARPLKTIEAFLVWGAGVPEASKAWIERLGDISDRQLAAIVEMVPDTLISSTAVEFTTKMLILNKERLMKIKDQL